MNTRHYNEPGHVCPTTGRRCITIEDMQRRPDLRKRKVYLCDNTRDVYSRPVWHEVIGISRQTGPITGLPFFTLQTRTHFLNVIPSYSVYAEQDFKDRARCHIYPTGKGGFNVRRDGVNPIPGAPTGFLTIRKAVLAVKVLERIERKAASGRKSFPFWDIYNRASGQWEKQRQMRNQGAHSMGMVIVRLDRHNHAMKPGPSPVDLFEKMLATWR